MPINYRAEVIGSMLRPAISEGRAQAMDSGKTVDAGIQGSRGSRGRRAIALQEKMRRRRHHRRRDAPHALHRAADRRDFRRQGDSRVHAAYGASRTRKIRRPRKPISRCSTPWSRRFAGSVRSPTRNSPTRDGRAHLTAQSHAAEPADDDAPMVARIFARRLSRSVRSVLATRPISSGRRRASWPRSDANTSRSMRRNSGCCATRSAGERILPSAEWIRSGC